MPETLPPAPAAAAARPLWRPDAARIADAPITRFTDWLKRRHGLAFDGYEALWQWSIDELEQFWAAVAEFSEVRFHTPPQRILAERRMPGARWFEGATLNFAEHLLRRAGEPDAATRPALVFRNERGRRRELDWRTLALQAGSVAAQLRALGVGVGDRVVAYAPNIPETVVAFLAAASQGAIWSACAPDLGATSVLDRFRQIAPRVLIATDGYHYGGKRHDRSDVLAELVRELPSLEAVILIPYLDDDGDDAAGDEPGQLGGNSAAGSGDSSAAGSGAARIRTIPWRTAIASPQPPTFTALPFDAPLWIVYSSGTTGMPKPIVHGHGGTLLNAFAGLPLHLGIGRDDRFIWFSSTSWIMWNLWVSALATGATLLHHDGNPGWPDATPLWQLVAEERATIFGTSPAFIANCSKAGLVPRERFDLSALRTLGATGSPLTDDAYEWVYGNVKQDLLLASISGGTDPGAAFLTSCPTLPVYAGEMQCRALGAAIAAYDDDGRPRIGAVGELVCTAPMPSMPLHFWRDADGSRYFDSYFDTWPGVWRHGDWLELIERPESVTSRIYGRSDSTINRHGIRMGTSEIYRIVESFDTIRDSLAVDLEYLGRPSFLALFVVLPDGRFADPAAAAAGATGVPDELRQVLLSAIRTRLSARHVPDQVYAIPDVPRTLTGKKLEVPIKRILLGHPVAKAVNRDSMANPAVIDWFVRFAAARG
ncbi:MAG: acetoacetate--CoA ligase [Lautropia sp.]